MEGVQDICCNGSGAVDHGRRFGNEGEHSIGGENGLETCSILSIEGQRIRVEQLFDFNVIKVRVKTIVAQRRCAYGCHGGK